MRRGPETFDTTTLNGGGRCGDRPSICPTIAGAPSSIENAVLAAGDSVWMKRLASAIDAWTQRSRSPVSARWVGSATSTLHTRFDS